MIMRVIHTVMRNGQTLHPKVMEGVAKNDCALLPITSYGNGMVKIDRENVCKNWNDQFRYLSNQLFIGMDSDAVLGSEIIDDTIKYMEKEVLDLVIITDKEKSNKHGLWIINNDVIKSVPLEYDNPHSCNMCIWFSDIGKLFDVKRVVDNRVEFVNRLEVVNQRS